MPSQHSRFFAALLGTIVLGAGLVVATASHADACSPTLRFKFEYLLEADTLDDLHDPAGSYATDWNEYWEAQATRREPEFVIPDLRRVTGVAVVHTVAEASTRGNGVDEDDRFVIFGGTRAVKLAWGDFDASEHHPQEVGVRPNAHSCGWNSMHDYAVDGWWLSNTAPKFQWPERTSIATNELQDALTRLFGEPNAPARDLPAEREILERLTARLQEFEGYSYQGATWLNPATGQPEPWSADAPSTQEPLPPVQTPVQSFTG